MNLTVCFTSDADQEGKSRHLDWPARFNICLGVARGLHYLHTSAQPRIIHRDIKASNVLLDKDLQPKIADFGLALFFPDEQSRIITSEVAGTR
jgi:serine/threonine protein kinase